jgi:hypothetical protein
VSLVIEITFILLSPSLFELPVLAAEMLVINNNFNIVAIENNLFIACFI